MKTSRSLLIMGMFLFVLNVSVQGNGLNLNSLGTKGLAMGGAFVGLADDFSAIYWNPAGMAFFKTQIFGLYGTDFIPNASYRFDIPTPDGNFRVVDAETPAKHYFGGLLAYYHPINKKFVAGIGCYTPSGLGVEWDSADFSRLSFGNPNIEWKRQIRIITIAPGLAFRLNEWIAMGVALNINHGMFDLATHAGSIDITSDLIVNLGQYEESMKGWGYGAAFGIMVIPNSKISLGATFRTASTIKFNGEASMSGISTLNSLTPWNISIASDLERKITWPIWIAGGIAVHPLDNLTITADVQFTQWSQKKTEDTGLNGDADVGLGGYIKTDFEDPGWQLMMTANGNFLRAMFWEDKLQIRLGAEYRFRNLAVRGGYYWDPSPAPDQTMNFLLPNYDFHVLTAGFGYSLNNLQIDFGIEYLRGKERNIPSLDASKDLVWDFAMAGIYRMHIVVPNISLSYKF